MCLWVQLDFYLIVPIVFNFRGYQAMVTTQSPKHKDKYLLKYLRASELLTFFYIELFIEHNYVFFYCIVEFIPSIRDHIISVILYFYTCSIVCLFAYRFGYNQSLAFICNIS